ncbi:PREDICTED: F-box/LRR-repeat protein 20-like [Fragaria vesca subsp. vesca]|uniref:F-box/LRR-repeat protein 20-like n=1 Tax=Fragaria vesca subsp. vesca TaxID=101020 RepID=UPI0002C3785A|nr:PREDICTED: F-box/LRR-repeat protein 20-like [Fragaria vesca subsp. vesca]
MNALCDDELALILNWIKDSDDRKSVSQVCKQWWQVESQNRSSIRVLDLDILPALLHRFPNLVTFQTPKSISNDNLELLAQGCPKLEVLDLTAPCLSPATVMTQGLCTLANRGPGLSKVSLRGRRLWDGRDTTTASFEPFGNNLKHLDLGNCLNVYDTTLFKAIGSSSCSITVLNLERSRITDCGLGFLTDGSCSNTIKELVLEGCRYISDSGVSLLRKMCVLEELSLAFCKRVTDVGGVAISAIGTLKKLNLVSGPKVTDTTIVALAKNCLNLETLELRHNEFVTGDGIRAFLGHKCLQVIDLRGTHTSVVGCDLEELALACPSLKSIVVAEGSKERLFREMQDSTLSRFMCFH